MALSRVHTWVSGEVLTASDINAEFNNPLTNALALISPLTGNLAAGNFKLTGLAAGSAAGDSVRWEQLPVKVWASIANTGTPSVLQSFNVASLIDTSTGKWGLTFTTAFSTATYAMSASTDDMCFVNYVNTSVSRIDITTRTAANAVTDCGTELMIAGT